MPMFIIATLHQTDQKQSIRNVNIHLSLNATVNCLLKIWGFIVGCSSIELYNIIVTEQLPNQNIQKKHLLLILCLCVTRRTRREKNLKETEIKENDIKYCLSIEGQ